jgi:hypothetical protein
MKTLRLLTAMAGLFIGQINSHAQGVYFGVGGGYAFPSGLQPFTTDASTTPTGASYTSKSYSLGSGVPVMIYGGYMVTPNIGLELGISEKFTSSTSSTVNAVDTTGFTVRTSTDVWTAKGSLFSFTPAIRLMTGAGKLQLYTVTGLVIGIPSATLEDAGTTVITNPGGTTTDVTDRVWTYSGGMVYGFHGAAGVVYMLSDKIGIFGEVAANLENWAPGQSLITTATSNGSDMLPQMTTSEKQTDYVSSYSVVYASSSPGSPAQSAKIYLPFSSWGINIGVHFSLGGSAAIAPK